MSTAPVSEYDAVDDRTFFLSNPKRRYRARRDADSYIWVIRRRPRVMLLRTRSGEATSLPPDNDNAIRPSWVSAAWPWLSALERTELVREIKQGEPRR